MAQMEKIVPVSKRPRRTSAILFAFALLSVYLLVVKYESGGYVFNAILSSPSPPSDYSGFSWKKLPSSESLNFQPCFGSLNCARLSLPLDWMGTDVKATGKQVSVALVRVPAKVPITDPRYGGPILLNPGGPGGSGVMFAIANGEFLQQIVDAPYSPTSEASLNSSKYFDIIGFDPRGVNNTTPTANCFPSDSSLSIWLQRADAQGYPYSNESFANSWSRHASFARSCTWRLGDDDNDEVLGIGRYLNTPSVVEDMRAIIEAFGEWREKEAKRLSLNMQLTAEIQEAVRWKYGREKLLYMGFSYGTLLGATFAAMHPDRVERMVLDGVVNADDYYSAQWMSNIQDADSIIESFFKNCNSVKEKCAIFSPQNPGNPKEIYHSVLDTLRKAPLIVPGHDNHPPAILTYHDLMKVVLSATYSPYPLFGLLASILHNLSVLNGTMLAAMKQEAIPFSCQSPFCKQHPWLAQCQDTRLIDLSWSALNAIACTDGSNITSWTQDDHYRKWQDLKSQSSLFAGFWSEVTMPCSNWDLRPAWNFNSSISASNTAHPILWLSNTRDPVTRVQNAFYMKTRFPGSVVVQQEADGHGAFSRPGICISKIARQYFQNGDIPQHGIVCNSDLGPFDPLTSYYYHVNEIDRSLLKASEGIAISRYKRHWPLGL